MGASFTPVQAAICEATAQCAGSFNVNAERLEQRCARRRELILTTTLVRNSLDPARSHESVVKKYGDSARHMVIAGSSSAQPDRGLRFEIGAACSRKNAQLFKGARHI